MSISDRNTPARTASSEDDGAPAFPEIPVRADVASRARVRAEPVAAEVAATEPDGGRRDGDGNGKSRGKGLRERETAGWPAVAPAPAEDHHEDELLYDTSLGRWTHPESGAVWNAETEAWETDADGNTPPSWTPPALIRAELPPRRRRPKIKKLRVLALLGCVGLLATISTVFGMMMAVASELPNLENKPEEFNSSIVDYKGRPLGTLVGNDSRILVESDKISLAMKHAIIAVEDRRFYENEGVDVRGIARALYQDIVQQRVVQGGSTITQQFVKNATRAQDQRTLFNKLREAALAFHLTRKWSKEKILKEYLNSIYFGNGAYGIESAARTYFGTAHNGCKTDKERPCALQLEPHEAALIAGVVASPSLYDPVTNPEAAKGRRDIVLARMRDEGYLTPQLYEYSVAQPLPTKADIEPPREESDHPYFVSWVRQQVVDKMGARKAFSGGLKVVTTLDKDLQQYADDAVRNTLPLNTGMRAAVVVLDNSTAEVRAMVAGVPGANKAERLEIFNEKPFNIATQGQRQPGSSFKPFILAAALQDGISPDSTWASKKMTFTIDGGAKFEVNNYEDAYAGVQTLRTATTYSDNAVYAQVGLKVGTKKIARLAKRMGIRTPVSTNAALTLGAPRRGFTVLDMAHAYQTFATGGKLRWGRLSPFERAVVPGPAGLHEILECRGGKKCRTAEFEDGRKAKNLVQEKRVLPQSVADQANSIMATVVTQGTAKRADLGPKVFAAGKTGTTENYGDAWFVGFTKQYTMAVWVGYPDQLKPMTTEFGGEPVAGGTYPAMIWRAFMKAVIDRENAIKLERARRKALKEGTVPPTSIDQLDDAQPTGTPAPVAPSSGGGAGGTPSTGEGTAPAPAAAGGGTPAPAPAPQEEAAPAPVQPEQDAPPEQEEPAAPAQPQQPPGSPPSGAGGGAAAPPPGDG